MSRFIKVDELQQKIENDPRIIENNTGYFDDVILVDDIYDVIDKCKQYEIEPKKKTIKIDCMTEEDYEKVLEWLEKNEPQKPIPSKTKISFVSVYECPRCGKQFTGTGVADYCYKCGQHFDWRKE